jgi:hypothetical protein
VCRPPSSLSILPASLATPDTGSLFIVTTQMVEPAERPLS